MSKIKTHSEDCERLLGEGYIEVHEDLDEMAKEYSPQRYLEYHRQFRHTEKYLNEKKKSKEWGFYRLLAAKIHIIRDYEMYVLNKSFSLVEIEEIEELWEKVKHYLHKEKK